MLTIWFLEEGPPGGLIEALRIFSCTLFENKTSRCSHSICRGFLDLTPNLDLALLRTLPGRNQDQE